MLLYQMAGLSREQVKSVLHTLVRDRRPALERIKDMLFPSRRGPEISASDYKLVWPGGLVRVDQAAVRRHKALRRFLATRRIPLDVCMRRNAYFCPLPAGEWALRFVVPIYEGGKMVGMQGRDTTGIARSKYHTPIGCPLHHYLYGLDLVSGGDIFVVEGIFDAWRLGTQAVATFGTKLSDMQLSKLLDKGVSGIIMSWDGDAYNQAKVAVKPLLGLVNVKVLRLPHGHDPDSLGDREVRNLERSTPWM